MTKIRGELYKITAYILLLFTFILLLPACSPASQVAGASRQAADAASPALTASTTPLQPESTVVKVNIYREMTIEGDPLHTFTSAAETQVFGDALDHAQKVNGTVDIRMADFTAVVYTTEKMETVYFWIDKESCALMHESEPGALYTILPADAERLRSLYNDFIKGSTGPFLSGNGPIEGDIDAVLKNPTPDPARIPPEQQGMGTYSVQGREMLDALLGKADGRVDLVMPKDANLILDAAVVNAPLDYSMHFTETATGYAVIFYAVKGERDFYPWDMKWKQTTIGGQSFYRENINRKAIGLQGVYLYWKKNGWTLIEQVNGKPTNQDLVRYTTLGVASYNTDKEPIDNQVPLIKDPGKREEVLKTYSGITFAPNYSLYGYVNTGRLDSFEQFLSTRLGVNDYYYYDGEDATRINVETDGRRITFLVGNLVFSYQTNFDFFFPDAISYIESLNNYLDWGKVEAKGVTYHYETIKNNKKYLTNVTWMKDGVTYTIAAINGELKKVEDATVLEWVSHVKHATIKTPTG